MPLDGSQGWSDRRRATEDDYFRKRDQELVERARREAERDAELRRLSEVTGVDDGAILRDLQQLGFDADTVTLIHMMPLIEVAWIDGGVSDPERNAIVDVARARGIAAGSAADRRLAEWLTNPPSPVLNDATRRLLVNLMQRRPPDERAATRRDLVASCTTVASASGGIRGFRTISQKEQQVLDRINDELG